MERHTHTTEECRRLLGQLNESIDGELAEELCHALDSHLAGCADCRVVFDTLARTVVLYRGLRDVPVELPADVEARLLARVEQARASAGPR
jgi:predicted anti-sigma-YlaC factor YlaD